MNNNEVNELLNLMKKIGDQLQILNEHIEHIENTMCYDDEGLSSHVSRIADSLGNLTTNECGRLRIDVSGYVTGTSSY